MRFFNRIKSLFGQLFGTGTIGAILLADFLGWLTKNWRETTTVVLLSIFQFLGLTLGSLNPFHCGLFFLLNTCLEEGKGGELNHFKKTVLLVPGVKWVITWMEIAFENFPSLRWGAQVVLGGFGILNPPWALYTLKKWGFFVSLAACIVAGKFFSSFIEVRIDQYVLAAQFATIMVIVDDLIKKGIQRLFFDSLRKILELSAISLCIIAPPLPIILEIILGILQAQPIKSKIFDFIKVSSLLAAAHVPQQYWRGWLWVFADLLTLGGHAILAWYALQRFRRFRAQHAKR